MPASRISLREAVDLTRTGDVWLFRGRSVADRAIQAATNSPVNHVGMALTIEDLPPLMWHAELGRSLEDLWSGGHRRGVQLHDLHDAVTVWADRYGQRAWLRQLRLPPGSAADPAGLARQHGLEDDALRTVARLSGTPFPSTAALAGRWLAGRAGRLPTLQAVRSLRGSQGLSGLRNLRQARLEEVLETAYCAEVVAATYTAMGLLPPGRKVNWYDPGRFWSGDDLDLGLGARLGREIEVTVP